MLAKLGYRFDPDELEPWRVEAYALIASTISDERERELKRKRK